MKRILSRTKLVAAVVFSVGCAQAQKCGSGGGEPGHFDYYVLSLSWAPGFCDSSAHPSARECGTGRNLGFVVHGLWPQYEHGRSPEGCAPARPMAHDIVDRMLPEMPDAGLVQHEWACHGTCSGLPPRDYFDLVDRAYRAVRLPDELRSPKASASMRVAELEKRFADWNHASPDSVRVVCHSGELLELRLCMTKDLKLRACSESVRDCPAAQVMVLPVR